MAFRFGFNGFLYIAEDETNSAALAFDSRPVNIHPAINYQTVLDADDTPNGPPSYAWREVDNVKDVTMDGTTEKEDTTTRSEAKLGWKSEVPTVRDGKLSTAIRYEPDNQIFKYLRDAWLNNTPVALLNFDGELDLVTNSDAPNTTLGNQGLTGNFYVSFGIQMPVKGIMAVDVELSLASYPNWVYVKTTGGPTPPTLEDISV